MTRPPGGHGERSRIGLRVVFDGPALRFDHDLGDGRRHLPLDLDATILPDEHVARKVDGEPAGWGFTGAFAGLWVQAIGADGGHGDFDSVTWRTGVAATGLPADATAPGRR